ncbi:MAG: 50S ribosomal protein L32 [Bernardetiaceae bacterium]|jgi:large subunit ribosomal protein L32|nr:50S ribosomal protein L32 [Bernardetiaceae bacterium]
MAHPKRKISSTRRDKRRAHHKLTPVALSTCPVTGVLHQSHRAYWVEDKMYYNGRVVAIRESAPAAPSAE